MIPQHERPSRKVTGHWNRKSKFSGSMEHCLASHKMKLLLTRLLLYSASPCMAVAEISPAFPEDVGSRGEVTLATGGIYVPVSSQTMMLSE